MSTDPKPPKPMPSAEEINAYLELSAARTKLRLPLAKGAARAGATPSTDVTALEKEKKRPLPVAGSKPLPARKDPPSPGDLAPPGHTEASPQDAAWRPSSKDDER